MTVRGPGGMPTEQRSNADGTGNDRTDESALPERHTLYRPRHGRFQRLAGICAAVFFLIPAVAFAVGVRPMAFENKRLASLPSPSQGWGFFTSMSGWATDHLPLRHAGVLAEKTLSTTLFGELPPRSHNDSGAPLGPLTDKPKLRRSSFPPVIRGTDGWLYLGQTVSHKCVRTESLDETIALLRHFRRAVEASGRRFVLLIAPDKRTMVPQHLPANYAGKDCAQRRTTRFWQRVPRETGAIDLRPALRQVAARAGHPLYGPKDTHWTYQGGVVMTYALADALQPGVTRSWLTTPTKRVPWPADLPLLLGRKWTRHLQAYSLAPSGHTDRTRYVASNFRTPMTLTQGSAAGRSGVVTAPVGMIADSFTQFASPFLAATFSDITIVHPKTVAADPAGDAKRLLADKQVIVLELVERDVAGGASPLLRPRVLDAIGHVLRAHPVH